MCHRALRKTKGKSLQRRKKIAHFFFFHIWQASLASATINEGKFFSISKKRWNFFETFFTTDFLRQGDLVRNYNFSNVWWQILDEHRAKFLNFVMTKKLIESCQNESRFFLICLLKISSKIIVPERKFELCKFEFRTPFQFFLFHFLVIWELIINSLFSFLSANPIFFSLTHTLT